MYFIYSLGIIGLIIIFFISFFGLIAEISQVTLLTRNHLQRVTHPNLTVKGFGNYHIEYVIRGHQTFEYFKYCRQYEKSLEIMKKTHL